MHALFNLQKQKDPIKIDYRNFFIRSRAANSAVHGLIWSNLELIQDFMVVLVTCNNEKDPIKNTCWSVHNMIHQFFTKFLAKICKSMGIFQEA